MTQEERLATLVINKWGAENGVKYLSGVISTLITASQMEALQGKIDSQTEG